MSKSPEMGGSQFGPRVSGNPQKQPVESSEELLEITQLVLESIGEPVVVMNKDYEITLLNRAAREFLLADSGPLRPILCYQCHENGESTCEEMGEDCPLKKAQNSHEPLTRVHQHRRADGSKRFLEIIASPLWSRQGVFQGIVETARDITEQKKLHDVISLGKKEWQETFDIINDAITIHDRDLTVVRANRAAEQILGLPFSKIIGQKCYALFHGADSPPESCASCLALKSGRAATIEMFEPRVNKFLEIKAYPQMDENRKIAKLVHVIRDISHRKRIEERLHSLSITDELTGLFNRRGFSTLAERQVKTARRQNKGMFLLCVDLDGLKRINDALGHSTGDQALMETAGILRETFRDSDLISRIGGDEFAVFQIEDAATTPEMLTTRLRQNLAARNATGDRRYQLSFSIGVTYCTPESFSSINELLVQADTSMYEQKRYKQNSLFARGTGDV